ncbi:hypothetical protein FRB98_004712 [Tulasnella sp. 332]|nr:hypothetical protein FRB98_004712 [Tulasnella sp. 332]
MSAAFSKSTAEIPRGYSRIELCHNHKDSGQVNNTTVSEIARSLLSLDGFRPRWWSRGSGGGHLQTMASSMQSAKKADSQDVKTENIMVADYGNISFDLGFFERHPNTAIAVFVHGIGGEATSPYNEGLARWMAKPISEGGLGVRVVKLNLRGCRDLILTAPQIHHAGEVNDLGAAIAKIRAEFKTAPIYLVGSSLGAGIAMNYLGDMGEDSPVTAAFLQSPVHKFVESAEGFKGSAIHWIYNKLLGGFFTKMFKDNQRVFEDDYVSALSTLTSPTSTPPSSIRATCSVENLLEGLDSVSISSSDSPHRYVQYDDQAALETLERVRQAIAKGKLTLTGFSNEVVAPLAGYDTPEEFKITTSSARAIPNVRVPVLCVNACDDPLMKGKDLPRSEMYASPWVVMATTPKGGHLGFSGTGVDGQSGPDGRWSTRVGFEWFRAIQDANPSPRPAHEVVPWIAKPGWFHPRGRPEMRYMRVSKEFPHMMIPPAPYTPPTLKHSRSPFGLLRARLGL